MTRNSLLVHGLKPRQQTSPGVWRMTMDLIGQAFGAGPAPDRERRR